jgi:hypothetical protein
VKKTVVFLISAVVIIGIGFFAYKYFFSSKSSTTGQNHGTNATQICDTVKSTCSEVAKTSDSGSLKVTILNGSNPVPNLEVDVATKPGAQTYYLKLTDETGLALFEGIPEGTYSVYFNQNNFPTSLGNPPTQSAQVVKGEVKETIVNLTP